MTIAVDLDGTLAAFTSWNGRHAIGDPLPGAINALNQLVADGHVVYIYTCRCSHELNESYTGGYTVEESARFVELWLTEHGVLPQVTVYTGRGKPMADLYLDDRAMTVAPMQDAGSWGRALQAIHEMTRTIWKPEPPSCPA